MKNTPIKHKDFLAKQMKNKKFASEFNHLETEFKIIELLIKARHKNNLSQRQLADRLGIHQSSLARFESGNYNPTILFLQKIAGGLGVKLKISISK
jgi:ribosome-binding protein aMBF1 (putative translation factor)